MRKSIVAGNWKMNTTIREGKLLASEIIKFANSELNSNVEWVIIPPYTHLGLIKGLIGYSERLKLGAQNCSQYLKGAYTGEISVQVLEEIGVEYVILGHSERRQYFNETSESLKEKINIVLEKNITPIFCCGESLEIRKKDLHFETVSTQITESLFHLDENQIQKVVIAYEPIWAIGTGMTATSSQAQEMHAYIRQHIAKKYHQKVAQELSILYGGSVNDQNAKALFQNPDVDGGLVGGASLKVNQFINIAQSFG